PCKNRTIMIYTYPTYQGPRNPMPSSAPAHILRQTSPVRAVCRCRNNGAAARNAAPSRHEPPPPILAKRNTAFSSCKNKVLCAALRTGPLSGRDSRLPDRRATPHRPCGCQNPPADQPAIPPSDEKFPVWAAQIPCFEKNRVSPAGSSNCCAILRL